MASGSKVAVYSALGANSVVMVAKFGAFAATGSGSMLSEGIHSLADVGNQALLAFGISSAQRAPDETHPYGYGREEFIWAMISAVGIFFLGCGVTAMHGIDQLLHPHPVEDLTIALGVLAFAFVIEGLTLLVAVRAVRGAAQHANMRFFEYMVKGTDPMGVAVVLEDGAAVLGVTVAAIALGLAQATGNPLFDALGTLSISLLMGLLALFLVRKNRALLLGQAIQPARQDKIVDLLENDPVVGEVEDVKATVTGSGALRFKAEIDFDGQEITRRYLAGHDLAQMRAGIGDDRTFETFLIDFGDHVIDQLAKEVDRLEAEIVAAAPMTKHVDLEAD